MSNFVIIRPVWAEFHADRQTDRHDGANGRFSQFWERADARPFNVSVNILPSYVKVTQHAIFPHGMRKWI
jgi:hypothetical protein